MAQKMTWEEMKTAFPDEWLLIVDVERDESGFMISGVVERHSADPYEIGKPPIPRKSTSCRYTGESRYRGLRSRAAHHNCL